MGAPKGNKNRKKHGLSHKRIDNIYKSMISRCYCKGNSRFHRYGVRSIIVCEEWKNDKTKFFEWSFKNGYQKDLTIDRIDSNGIYSPENCRWTTQKVQQNNRCNNRRIQFNGEEHTLSEWSEITGIKLSTIWARLNSGWPIDKALTTKVRRSK